MKGAPRQWLTRGVVLTVLAVASCRHDFFANGWTISSTQRVSTSNTSLRRRHPCVLSSSITDRNAGDRTFPSVVVVGGGFGGLTCQKELHSILPNAKITLVEPNDRFTFLPLLYEYLGGFADLDEIAPTYDYLLSSPSQQQGKQRPQNGKVSVINGSAVEVNPKDKYVMIQTTPSGTVKSLQYDALVLSCGVPPSVPKPNRPGIPSTAYSFATLDDAVRLKRQLGNIDKDSSIVVVGGGYIGSELACTLSKIVPKQTKLSILHRDPTGICQGAETYNREEAMKRLESLGVNIELGASVTKVVSKTSPDGARYDDVQFTRSSGDEGSIRADVLIWTVSGSTNKPRKVVKGLPVDKRGRVVVSPACEVYGMEHVFAVGDGAIVSKSPPPLPEELSTPYPATAQVAMQQARLVASNIQAEIEGTPLQEFQYQSLGEMLSLGGDEDASISSLNGLFRLNGPLASTARRLVYAARMPSPKQAVRSGAGYVNGVLERGVCGALNFASGILGSMTR